MAGLLDDPVQPVNLVLQHAHFLSQPDRVQDQLTQHVQADLIGVAARQATGLEVAHQTHELRADRAVRLDDVGSAPVTHQHVMSPRDGHGGGLTFPMPRQSIVGGVRRLERSPGFAAERLQHLDGADARQYRHRVCGLAIPNKFNGQLPELTSDVPGRIPHTARA